MKQVITFDNVDNLNKWLKMHLDIKIIKIYSNGPNYFFVFYKHNRLPMRNINE